jgi:hypothetical protein
MRIPWVWLSSCVELLAHELLHQRGFARRCLAEKNDFDLVELAPVFAEFLEVVAHGLRGFHGEFDGGTDEGAVWDVDSAFFNF